MSKAAAPQAEAAPKSKKTLFIIIAVVVVLLAGGGAGAFFLLRKPAEADKAAAAAAEAHKVKKAPVFIPFEAIVVNLKDEGGDRMMQLAFSFEGTDSKSDGAVKSHLPAIRSRLILMLSSKTSKDVAGREGKEKLAADILEETRAVLGATKEAPVIEAVHFTSMIIQ
jgi:flagellar FliL protein